LEKVHFHETKDLDQEERVICHETKDVCQEEDVLYQVTKEVGRKEKVVCRETKVVYRETKVLFCVTKLVCRLARAVRRVNGASFIEQYAWLRKTNNDCCIHHSEREGASERGVERRRLRVEAGPSLGPVSQRTSGLRLRPSGNQIEVPASTVDVHVRCLGPSTRRAKG
jgi:hypothetical protein